MVKTPKVKVAKTISMDLDLANAILDEAEVMNRDFSGATTTLIKLGLAVRQDQKWKEEQSIREMAKTI